MRRILFLLLLLVGIVGLRFLVRIYAEFLLLLYRKHILVHLGDIARYKKDMKQAEIFYTHAAQLIPTNGQPFNQLALLDMQRVRPYCCTNTLIISAALVAPRFYHGEGEVTFSQPIGLCHTHRAISLRRSTTMFGPWLSSTHFLPLPPISTNSTRK